MKTRSEAEEHLRVIRSLMEKATIYRAIAAPTALVGGALAIAAAATLYFGAEGLQQRLGIDFSQLFIRLWLGVLLITAVTNVWFLYVGAQRRGEAFVSAGMRCALLALLPSYLAAAVCSVIFCALGFAAGLPPLWMIFHGLGLLATAHFAPRSIALLGWAFLITGLAAISLALRYVDAIDPSAGMALTFGVYHLLYAAGTWPREGARTPPIEAQ